MPIELTAHTEAGARLVAIAEGLAGELAERAAQHDRDGTYPFEAIEALRAANYFAALAVAAGNERRARNFGASLEQIVREGIVLAYAVSERGQDLTRPQTTATRTD